MSLLKAYVPFQQNVLFDRGLSRRGIVCIATLESIDTVQFKCNFVLSSAIDINITGLLNHELANWNLYRGFAC